MLLERFGWEDIRFDLIPNGKRNEMCANLLLEKIEA